MEKLILHYQQHDNGCKGEAGGYCKCDMDKTMELEWNKYNNVYEYRPDDEGEIKLYILRFEQDGSLFIRAFDKDGKYIDTESLSLNPLYYERIEETDGKIEVVTQFTVFGSKKKYDLIEYMKGYHDGIEELKEELKESE